MAKVKHVVLLRFKQVEQSRIDEVMAELAGLKDRIPGILDYSGGRNSSTEGLNQGFEYGFVMTFADEAARDAYLPHPIHEEVKLKALEILEGGAEGVVVLDWLE